MNARMPRSLYGRMEELETHLAPAGEHLVHKIQFISAVDHSVVKELEVRSPRLGPLLRNGNWFVASVKTQYRQLFGRAFAPTGGFAEMRQKFVSGLERLESTLPKRCRCSFAESQERAAQ